MDRARTSGDGVLDQLDEDSALLRHALQPVEVSLEACRNLLHGASRLQQRAGPAGPLWQFHPVRSFWLLHSGLLALGEETADGDFTEVSRVETGEWVDVFGALAHEPEWFAPVRALEPCSLLAIPVSDVLQGMASEPALGLAFADVLARCAGQLRDTLLATRRHNVCARLARRMLQETLGRSGHRPDAVWHLSVPKQCLAQQLGATSETLSRTLRHLSECGIIQVSRYDIRILDREALLRAAGGENSSHVYKRPARRALAETGDRDRP